MTGIPKGPRWAIWQTLHYARDPIGYYQQLAARYGDTFTSPSLNGPFVVTRCPAAIKALFSADPQTFGVFGGPTLRPIFGEGSLIMQEGEAHRVSRKLVAPIFHATRVRNYFAMMLEAVEQEIGTWPRSQAFSLLGALQSLSMRIILHTVFGVSADEKREPLGRAIIDLVSATSPSLLFIPFVRRDYLGLSPWRRYRKQRDQVKQLVLELITAHRQGNAPGSHILGLLCEASDEDGARLSDDALIEQLLTMVYSGYETTATSTAWALYLLARAPAARGRLRSELGSRDQTDWLENEYLEAICSETLRLYPVLPDIDRLLLAPLELAGHTLPRGWAVAVPISLVHYDARLYPEPQRFLPERFLARRYSPFEYLPFGGGTRRCIGASYALYQMKIIISHVLMKFELMLEDEAPVAAARRSFNLAPAGKILVRLRALPQATGPTVASKTPR